jgi:hypothetical protein
MYAETSQIQNKVLTLRLNVETSLVRCRIPSEIRDGYLKNINQTCYRLAAPPRLMQLLLVIRFPVHIGFRWAFDYKWRLYYLDL